MSYEYTPLDQDHATFTFPSGGDNRTAASLDLPLSQLADAITYWSITDRVLTPPAFTGLQVGYNPTGWSDAEIVRLSGSSSPIISGFSLTATRKVKTLVNISATSIIILGVSGVTVQPGTGGHTLAQGDACIIYLDDASSTWRVLPLCAAGSAYKWTGAHEWTNACTFDTNLTVKGNLTLADVANTGEVLYATPRARTLYLPVTDGISSGSPPAWTPNATLYWLDVATSAARLVFMPRLPRGAVVTGVGCVYDQVSAVSSGLTLEVAQITYSAAGSTSGTRTGTTGPTSIVTNQALSVACSHAIDATHGLWIGVTAPTAGSFINTLKSLSVSFTDPGPINV